MQIETFYQKSLKLDYLQIEIIDNATISNLSNQWKVIGHILCSKHLINAPSTNDIDRLESSRLNMKLLSNFDLDRSNMKPTSGDIPQAVCCGLDYIFIISWAQKAILVQLRIIHTHNKYIIIILKV